MNSTSKQQLELINQQLKELAGIYRNAISYSGISENEFWIWYALIITGGEYSQQDICGMWSLSKQTVNTIINRMVQRGQVTLEVVPGTRNRKIIHLTDTGRIYGERLVTPIFTAEQRAFDRLPAADCAACAAALSRYIKIFKDELNGTETE